MRHGFKNKATSSLARAVDHPIFWWFCFAIIFGIFASTLTTDRTFDFKNYHFYNGFAAFHDRSGLDIFPAHMQTAFFYGADAVYYLHFYIDESPSDAPQYRPFGSLLGRGAGRFFHRPPVRSAELLLAQSCQRGGGFIRSDRRCESRDLGDDGIGPRSRSGDSDRPGAMAHAREGWAQYGLDRARSGRPRRLFGGPQAHSGAAVRRHGPGDRRPIRDRQRLGAVGGVRVRPGRPCRLRRSRRRLALGQCQGLRESDFPGHEQRLQIGPCRADAVGRSPVHPEDAADGGVLSRVLGFPALKRRQRTLDARPANSARLRERCRHRHRFRRPLDS